MPPGDPLFKPMITTPPPLASQGASSFNQPLTLNMSSVKTMYRMFNVRSSPSPALIYSRAFPCTLLRTFSVTTMHAMLYVCSPR